MDPAHLNPEPCTLLMVIAILLVVTVIVIIVEILAVIVVTIVKTVIFGTQRNVLKQRAGPASPDSICSQGSGRGGKPSNKP